MIELPRHLRCVTIPLAGLLLIGSAPTPQLATPKVETVAAPVARAPEKPEQISEVAPEPPPLGRPCEPGMDTRTSELCAQWKAADAAADSAWWAKTGGVLGFASLLRELAALGLAFHSNWIARDTARRQLRAYLTFTQFILNTDKNDWKPQIEWENRGQTPALAVETNVGFLFSVDPLPDDFAFPKGPSREEEGPTPIGPGQVVQGTSEIEMDRAFMHQASRGLRHVYVWGSAEYLDIFGEKQQTLVAIKLDCEELSPGSFVLRWVAINRHNDMT